MLKLKNFNDEKNNFFMNGYCSKIRNYVKLMIKISVKWKNSRSFRVPPSDTIARRRLVEDQDTILELTGKIQDLQNEMNCMNDSKDFQDAESIRSGNSHVTSRAVSFPPHPIPEGMQPTQVGCNNSEKMWWMTKFQNMETLTPVLLTKYLSSPFSRDVRICINTVFILIS